jgi:eukaryotic-like serine/threonine-protein kinase
MSVLSPKLAAPTTIGRFETRRILGQGAQSVVWLAFDPRLEREVAIKLMRTRHGADTDALAQWLSEARSVSRLAHPNIVPVFEADVQDQQPYLVFEYVPGQTLAALLEQRGALPPSEAVDVMLDVLDALTVAHTAGVVHRDLKPSNIMVDKSGRARVMDFGIASQIGASQTGTNPYSTVGTPGYMSPEACGGGDISVGTDIFSAGLVLAEMLSGKPLVATTSSHRAIYQVTHEQLDLPNELTARLDDALRAVLVRALAKDPALRHPDARIFHDELSKWRTPPAAPAADLAAGSPGAAASGTLEFLLRRMRHKSDFPALSDSVLRIQGIASSESESVGSVTNAILKDVALTNKLLRVVNTAHYARGGNISTVSRAVTLVGFNGIRNMALSLVMLEHMQDKAHAQLLKDEFLRSLMAGSLAGELYPTSKDSEEAFIGAMFQNLGRMLAEFYFPEETREIRSLVSARKNPVNEATASLNVLGLGYEALGMGVAKAWGLPQGMRLCMKKPTGEPPVRSPADSAERMRWTALAANDIADTLLTSDPKDVEVRLAELAQRYSRTLGVSPGEVKSATLKARQKLIELATAMDIKVQYGSPGANLLMTPEAAVATTGAYSTKGPNDTHDALQSMELQATQAVPATQSIAAADEHRRVTDMLAAGIADITNLMVEDFKLTDVLRMIIETMFRAMDFQRVVFCLRDPKTESLTGRFGLGADVERVVAQFKVSLKAANPDLFAAVSAKGADTMINDATEARIANRLPAWYRQSVNAPTFLLLPLQMKGAPFGLIYADKAAMGALALDEKQLALLRTLRNQAVMAFKQSS